MLLNLLAISLSAIAQRHNNNRREHPYVYLGFSTGINNPTGILGIDIDVAPTDYLSINTGVGLSTWGFKYFGEGKYYFSPNNRGWALGLGITHNTGIENVTFNDMETTSGSRSVLMDIDPVTNIMISGLRYWNLGGRNNRFFLRTGYSIRVVGGVHPYAVKNGYTLTDDTRKAMDLLAPDGIIIGTGLSFAL